MQMYLQFNNLRELPEEYVLRIDFEILRAYECISVRNRRNEISQFSSYSFKITLQIWKKSGFFSKQVHMLMKIRKLLASFFYSLQGYSFSPLQIFIICTLRTREQEFGNWSERSKGWNTAWNRNLKSEPSQEITRTIKCPESKLIHMWMKKKRSSRSFEGIVKHSPWD